MIVPQYDFDRAHGFAGGVLIEHRVQRAFYQKPSRTLVQFMAYQYRRVNPVKRAQRIRYAFVSH